MKALVIYESMFGSTRKIAESISAGLAGDSTVAIASVRDADARSVDLADLIVLGAPTHVHGLSMPATRAVAGAMAKDPGRHLELDEHAMDIGMREWLESIPPSTTLYAAFDTRRNMPRILTGAASVTIAKVLGRRGLRPIVRRASFLVEDDESLKSGELERARAWGERIGRLAAAAAAPASRS
jgi:hypothetical protein